MHAPAIKSLIGSPRKITILSVGLLFSAAQAAMAAQPVFPLPPVFEPPPPPCISTASLFEFPPGCYTCDVRDVSANNYTVTINMVNAQNQSEDLTPPTSLTAGRSIFDEICTTTGFLEISCVVTTSDGKTTSLNDLAVVEQYAPTVIPEGNASTSNSEAETEGKIYNSCVTTTGPVSTAP
jgi:hypothetical protein